MTDIKKDIEGIIEKLSGEYVLTRREENNWTSLTVDYEPFKLLLSQDIETYIKEREEDRREFWANIFKQKDEQITKIIMGKNQAIIKELEELYKYIMEHNFNDIYHHIHDRISQLRGGKE